MFKIKWDSDINGVLLSEYIEENEALNSPRPVYVDEFKMLGLNSAFKLPSQNVPICWEIDRKYFYKGEIIAETQKGNIYEDPNVIVHEEHIGRKLNPINIDLVVKNNSKMLSVIEDEAMDFIKEKYNEQPG